MIFKPLVSLALASTLVAAGPVEHEIIKAQIERRKANPQGIPAGLESLAGGLGGALPGMIKGVINSMIPLLTTIQPPIPLIWY
jgi:hypothetical protein